MTTQPNPDHRTAMCLRRIHCDGDSWHCVRTDEHGEDECCGYPNAMPLERNEFGPEMAQARRWR